jgi:hypothetical protein
VGLLFLFYRKPLKKGKNTGAEYPAQQNLQ